MLRGTGRALGVLAAALLAAVDSDAATASCADQRPEDHASPGMLSHDLPLGA